MIGTTVLDPTGLWARENDPRALVADLRARAEAAWAEYLARTPRGPAIGHARKREEGLASGALVPNDPFRERLLVLIERGEDDLSSVCRRLGGAFCQKDGKPDTSFLLRVVGLLSNTGTYRKATFRVYGDEAPVKAEFWHGHTRGHRRYFPGGMRSVVEYDLALRLAEALDLDPTDAGI